MSLLAVRFEGKRLPIRQRRPDGWPLCPVCDDDELYSVSFPATEETIVGCYVCGPFEFLEVGLAP